MSVKTRMSAEQLWEMPEVPGKQFELVRGELVEMPGAGAVHTVIARLVFRLLDGFVVANGIGEVFQDGLSYILQRDPDIVRTPDVSFVAGERVPADWPAGFLPLAPDLAVEVVSPYDRAEDVHAKTRDYLEGGTRLVWVLWPSTSTVSVRGADGMARELGPDDELDGGDVLPGFRVRVGDLFAIRPK